MKKIVSFVLTLILAVGCLSLFACGGDQEGSKTVKDDKTINVRVYKAGFGDAWAYELKSKFESVFSEEGYKMNITTPSIDNNGDPMIQEMYQGYKKTGIDLYIVGSLFPNAVVDGQYGTVVEDLTDLVYNKKAINYDGTESTEIIKNKIDQDALQFMYANNGTLPIIPWAQTSAGVVVNIKKLAAYGITELPKTTNEWFDIIEKIYFGSNGIGNSLQSKTYPLTYSMGRGATYTSCAIRNWLAQYDIDAYNEFMRFQKKNGDSWINMTPEECYKTFENENLKEAMSVFYRLLDTNIAADGSVTQDLDQAQGLIMKDRNAGNNAVFMLNGDWFLNEVKLTYKNSLDDIRFMNVPVISSLGVKLFGAGTSYNKSEEDCDKILSYICGLVDENKDIADIITLTNSEFGINLLEEDAQKVCNARGVCYARGIEQTCCITKGSTKKEIAALAIRMLASDDFANTFMNEANAATPFVKNLQIQTKYEFCKTAMNLVLNKYSRFIAGRSYGQREQITGFAGAFFPSTSSFEKDICLEGKTMYNADYSKGTIVKDKTLSVYSDAANSFMLDIQTKARNIKIK